MKNRLTLLLSVAIVFAIGCKEKKAFDNYQVFPIMRGSIVLNQKLLDECMQKNLTRFNEYRTSTDPTMETVIMCYNNQEINIRSVDGKYYEIVGDTIGGIESPKKSLMNYLNGLHDNLVYSDILDTIVDGNKCCYLVLDSCSYLAHNIEDKVFVYLRFCNYYDSWSIKELFNSYYFVLP